MASVASPTRRVHSSFPTTLPPQLDTTHATFGFSLSQPVPSTPSYNASSYTSAHGYQRPPYQDSRRSSSYSRKRARAESGGEYATPTHRWDATSADSSIQRSANAVSPPPFVNTTYRLAGGMDTPTLAAEARFEACGYHNETDYRRRWSNGEQLQPDSTFLAEKDEQSSMLVSSPSKWSKFVFTFVAGAAGKMWEFCRSNAFKGFYAGGGRGYAIRCASAADRPTSSSSLWEDFDEKTGRWPVTRKQLPGEYPRDSFDIPTEEVSTPQRPRPAKRMHTDTGWVMVGHPYGNNDDEPDGSPRLAPRRTPAPPTPRPASRAGTRRSLIPVSRRATTTSSFAGSPALNPNRQASTASMRSPSHAYSRSEDRPQTPHRASTAGVRHSRGQSLGSVKSTSPLSAEAQRYIARCEKEDRDADRSMRKMNQQLRDLIRQGKEALGSKVEVFDGGNEIEDEGFADGYDY